MTIARNEQDWRADFDWAMPRINACETPEDAFELFAKVEELQITHLSVGMVLLRRFRELGLDPYSSYQYGMMEKHFGYTPIWECGGDDTELQESRREAMKRAEGG